MSIDLNAGAFLLMLGLLSGLLASNIQVHHIIQAFIWHGLLLGCNSVPEVRVMSWSPNIISTSRQIVNFEVHKDFSMRIFCRLRLPSKPHFSRSKVGHPSFLTVYTYTSYIWSFWGGDESLPVGSNFSRYFFSAATFGVQFIDQALCLFVISIYLSRHFSLELFG